MGGKSCGEVTIAHGNTKFTSLVVGVAADDDALAVGTLESDGLQSVLQRIERL